MNQTKEKMQDCTSIVCFRTKQIDFTAQITDICLIERFFVVVVFVNAVATKGILAHSIQVLHEIYKKKKKKRY